MLVWHECFATRRFFPVQDLNAREKKALKDMLEAEREARR